MAGMRRHPAPRVAPRPARLRQRIPARPAAPPFWGERRLWASLRCVEERAVHQKRVRRLLREPPVLVQPQRTRRAKRTPTGSTPSPTTPNAGWGIDRTKLRGEDFGGGSIVVGLDGSTQPSGGYAAGPPCPAPGRAWMRDHGGPPTAWAFMKAGGTVGMPQAFTSAHNPTGNAHTARVRRTRTAACRWRSEWTTPVALMRALDRWIAHDNAHDLPSSLGSHSPRPFERAYHFSHGTPVVAA
jgi:hypothetical protein